MRILACFLAILRIVFAHRILGIFPLAAKSHDALYQSIVGGLLERGHQVTVIRSLPAPPGSPENYEEFLLNDMEPIADSFNLENTFPPNLWNVYRDFSGLIEMSERMCSSLLKSNALSSVLNIHRDNPFDLALIELFTTDCPLGIAAEMNLTTIGISPCALMPWHYTKLNLMDFPSFIPAEYTAFATKMTFWERMENFLIGKVMKILFRRLQEQDNVLLERRFGSHVKKVENLDQNIALALVNQHFSVSGVKPLNPRVVEIGGAHIRRKGALPVDIEKFLNSSSKTGVIYINWGSIIRVSSLSTRHLEALRQALNRLPMKVIWKWEEGIPFPNKSSKILARNWLPQLEILCHPATKVFLTHGGLLSANEVASCGKPVIVTPFFGDQHLNAAAMVEHGVGLLLPLEDFSVETIYSRIREILQPDYQLRAQQMSFAFNDRLLEPLPLAIWWIEHILGNPSSAEFLRTLPVDLDYMKANNFHDPSPLHLGIFFSILGLGFLSIIIGICRGFTKVKLGLQKKFS
ncbi:UDP-glycosyltransferase UGT5-like [Lutzomyia longipalpis]|uniref:UDP-glycosyltransferase UGT5-like n=1 Tax=Lutzomyia longipalpis TaxID=7200 RepID=UPI0024832F7F|nr:UDP-glycosyltransferase UGT5-like [Lutzomyia longipalpis]XP_055683648.1 UDP-glycosyltransferase UGT5-like [Lutzomyia longipalpis]